MPEKYERESYESEEGRNTWRKNAWFLKEFFNYTNYRKWWYKESKYHWDLKQGEIDLLNESVNALSHNCTGPIRKPIKGLPRLGPFRHFSLWFPAEHGDHRFFYKRDQVLTYKDIVVDMMENLFPGYQTGYFFRVAYLANYGSYPRMHVHIALSALRYRQADREHVKTFFDTKNLMRQPYHSLYYLDDPILYSVDLKSRIESLWRTAIENTTGREVTSKDNLVYETKKDGQTILDGYHILRYIANQHLHTFQNVESLETADDGKVLITFKPKNGVNPESIALPPPMFVRRYLIRPMRTFGIQFRGRGFLNGTATFARVGNAASKLIRNRRSSNKNHLDEFLFDFPVAEIQKRAAAARSCLESGDEWLFRQTIMISYWVGDPEKKLAIMLEREREAKREARRKKQSEKMQKKYQKKKYKWDGEGEDLMAI